MRIQNPNNQPITKYNYGKMSTVFKSDKTDGEIVDAVITEIETDKNNKPKNNIASSVTIASLCFVAGIIMLSRGFHKNISVFLNKFKTFMEGKRENLLLDESKNRVKFYDFMIKRITFFVKKAESINNITSLKDILFMNLMYKTKPTKKIHASITSYFEKMSYKTVLDSYRKTQELFSKMNKKFDKLDDYILQNSPDEKIEYKPGKFLSKKELVEMARSNRESANIMVESFISKNSLDYRNEHIHGATSSLYSKFWDVSFKDFWSKNNKFKRKEMWQTFIAAEQVSGSKAVIADQIATIRNAITYTKADRIDLIREYISKLDGMIPFNDEEGIEIMKRLEWFTRHSEMMQDNKDLFIKELAKLREHQIPITSDAEIKKTLENNKTTYIGTIEELANETATGEIQDMLSIYSKIAPYELTNSGAMHSVKQAAKSFDKSVNLEIGEFFDKVRDLRLGAAPTDVLTIILSFFALSFGLGYAQDNDKRKSIMLKSGIPVAGGIATAILTATKLVSGGKSLALGFLSGIVLNQLGKIADVYRQRMKKN